VPDARREYTLHLRVLSFRELALEVAERLHEGDWIALGGYLRSERWPGAIGPRRLYEHTVVARHLDLAAATAPGEEAEGDV
jgi:single-stranded DNA-binding protein